MQSASESVNKVWFGLDVAKANFTATYRVQVGEPIVASALRKLKVRIFTRDLDGLRDLLAWIDSVVAPSQPVQVIMESTGSYSSQIAFWLRQLREELKVSIVNARQIKHFGLEMGVRSKTDIVDARVIACYGADRQPAANAKKPSIYHELRSLSRCRQGLVETKTKLELQRHELMREELCHDVHMLLLEGHEKLISHIEEQVQQIEKKMEDIVSSDSALKHDVDLLDTIKGVGRIIAIGILGEMGDLRDYHRSRQAACFAGMEPKLVSSGTYKGKTRLSKTGPAQVRRLLYLGVCSMVKSDCDFTRHYNKLVARGKIRMTAIGALMRKMLTVMRAILINNEPYDDLYESRPKKLKTA